MLLCYDEQEDLSLVLKWFFDQTRYELELKAFQDIKALDLSLSRIPDILFTQEALYNDKMIYLIAQSPAAGLPLTELTEEAAIAFGKTLTELNQEAATAFGKALTELHTKTMSDAEVDLSFLLEKVESIPDQYPSLSVFVERLKKLFADYALESHAAVLIHGDAHPGNIFYDPKTKKLTLIDFGACRTFYPAQDFAEFCCTNWFNGELLQAFIDSYTFPLTELEIKFAKVNFMLMFIPDFQTDVPEMVAYRNLWLKELDTSLSHIST